MRHVRIKEGVLFLCYVSRSVLSLNMSEIQKWDHFLCYISRSGLWLDILEIQRADQFLCYVLRSALSLDRLEIQRADHLFMLWVDVHPVLRHVRNTEGGPFLMLHVRFDVRPVIRHATNLEGVLFLCYVSRSVLSLDMLEIQRADHSLCCVLKFIWNGF